VFNIFPGSPDAAEHGIEWDSDTPGPVLSGCPMLFQPFRYLPVFHESKKLEQTRTPARRFASPRRAETPEPGAIGITIGSNGTNMKPGIGKYSLGQGLKFEPIFSVL
jgi:hypothetical protein